VVRACRGERRNHISEKYRNAAEKIFGVIVPPANTTHDGKDFPSHVSFPVKASRDLVAKMTVESGDTRL